jgi:hypothetical protein
MAKSVPNANLGRGMDQIMSYCYGISILLILYIFLKDPIVWVWCWLFPGPPHNV